VCCARAIPQAQAGLPPEDAITKIYNDGSGPTCGRYTLTVRNG